MKDFLSYIRVSTPKQGEYGVSLPEQRDAIHRYARDIGLTISSWFEDRETATKQGRPAFTAMLRELETRRSAGVIFYKVDRSSRNSQDWAMVDQLVDRGFEVHFAYDRLVLSRRGDRLTANIYAVLAADYVRNLREEVKKGFYGRLKQGLYPKPAPLGYINNGKGRPKTIDPVSGPLITQAFELYATGRFSLATLGEELWRRGLRSRHGQRVRLTTLAGILHNSFYIRLIKVIKTGQTFRGIHEPLVSTAVFETVQRILHRKTARKVLRHDFLFRQLLQCAHCGLSLIGELQKGRVYYRCHTRGCPTTTVREDAAEAQLLSLLQLVKFTPARRQELLNAAASFAEDSEVRHAEQRRAQQVRLANIDDRLKRLTDAYIDGAIEKLDLEQRKTALLMERQKLEEHVASDIRTSDAAKVLTEFLELAENACLLYEKAQVSERRELIEIVTSNRVVDGRTPRFTLCSPFAELAIEAQKQSGGPSPCRARTASVAARRLIRRFTRLFVEPATEGIAQRVHTLMTAEPSSVHRRARAA